MAATALLTATTVSVATTATAVAGASSTPATTAETAASVNGAAAGTLRPASSPRGNELTGPARGVDRFRQLFDHGRHRAAGGGRANQTSTNWAGYAADGGPRTSVTAGWIEPAVTCTSNGIAAFWIGLDGWGSSTVEQNGTGVDCTTGTPQQFAWWETYPANSIQQYPVPVSAGDHLTSTITSKPDGNYDMVLTDATQGWTQRNQTHVTGARNASAEIVAEAVTSGNNVTSLPDFHSVGFTGTGIDGGSLGASGAVPIDMTDSAGRLIATTRRADAAGDFTVDYTGSSQPMAATKPSMS